ncbi:NAD(P)H-binding protein [Chryseolinea soli]|uniref:NAD-dependent epimerase/dehydratase family protein n=1 Tax=Chryseolinea soli TaxID=2321403 RepID=A0A385T0F2_9BACT|nr:NAD(P)H-binding protein [Chryseolinea soli]AYB35580.1 NAD-dependent epimerase/dehydratase family protein [Chryseolinea soli]
MNIVLTGSVSHVGKPLTQELVGKGHSVTVITSKAERIKEIESLGATAAVGSMLDVHFLATTFQGADIVYLMETLDAVGGDFGDKDSDLIDAISQIGQNYKQAVLEAGINQIVHLSSIGAHMKKGNGFLQFHHNVETILKQLPEEVSIKFMRPVGFYTNMFGFIRSIKTKGAIISNYGGDKKEPWVSPEDIAAAITEEMDKPFGGRNVRYVASDEVSPNEIAKALGNAIGKPDLQWQVISDEQLLNGWIKGGFNPQIARGFVEMQASQRSGLLYEDYYLNKPTLGKVKLDSFAIQFAVAYHAE